MHDRTNFLIGSPYSLSIEPSNILFAGAGVGVLGLAFKTLADYTAHKRQQVTNSGQPQSPPSADQPAAGG